MGANCCSEDHVNKGGFDNNPLSAGFTSLEMMPYRDQTLQKNYLNQQYLSSRPNAAYARKVDQRPKLYHLVEDSRKRQFSTNALAAGTGTGVALPVHYINKYKAYYEGTWDRGQPNGLGKLYFENGSYFEGPFNNGQIFGNDGIYIYPDGSFKRGIIRNGKLQGRGRFVSRSGNFSYDGNWQNDQPHGQGIQRYPDGSQYEGNFVNGKKHDDNAVYRWANGKVYQGPFRDGYMEGQGRLAMTSGKGEYVGQFSRNLKKGNGVMKTQTGEYRGPFENGQMHGTGVFKWYDGKVYEGQFQRGELHGPGVMYYPNGQMVRGVWHRGENLQMQKIEVGKSQVK